ncbi:MAG: sugar transferase, partial [Candidatus Omnitrophica bacterium]|nr:sugar transferase [Candidatus Omnitrophota bacterium]
MLKEKERLIRRATMVLDALVVTMSFFITYFLREHFHDFYKLNLIPSQKVLGAPVGLDQYLVVLFLWVPIWVAMLGFSGMYRSFRTRSFLEMSWDIVKAAFFSVVAFGGLAFILKIQFVSRVFFVMFIVIATGLLLLEKWTLVSISHHTRKIGYNFRQLLVVGTGPRAGRFIRMIQSHPEWGLRIIGLIDDDITRLEKEFFGIKVIGVLADIPRILREEVIDEVIFIVPRMWLERIQESIADCEIQGVRTSVAADLFDLRIARARQTDLNGFPLMSFETTFGQEWQLFIKRIIDLTVSFFSLILLSPVLLIFAFLIKL